MRQSALCFLTDAKQCTAQIGVHGVAQDISDASIDTGLFLGHRCRAAAVIIDSELLLASGRVA